MQEDIGRRIGLQTSLSKSTSKDQAAMDQKVVDSEVKQELSCLLETLSDPIIQKLRSFALQQIATVIPQLSTCGNQENAHRLLENFLGKVLSKRGSNLAEVMEAYRQEGLKLKTSYTLAKTAVHHLNATLGKRNQEKTILEKENERLAYENLRLREQNKFFLMELHKRDEPPGPHSDFRPNKDVF